MGHLRGHHKSITNLISQLDVAILLTNKYYVHLTQKHQLTYTLALTHISACAALLYFESDMHSTLGDKWVVWDMVPIANNCNTTDPKTLSYI